MEYDACKSMVDEDMSIIRVMGTNPKNKRIFAYIAFLSSMQDDVMASILSTGVVPDFSIIIEQGSGVPSPKIKARMKNDYLFDEETAERLQ